MIPQTQLETIKPFQDQTNRINQVKSKRKQYGQRLTLTKRSRQWAWFGSSGLRIMKDYKGPQGQRSYGNLPIKERKK
uniref:ORF38 n=1 Tax=Nitrosopumilaceae spindle-shaped virus TaxID=3065433 RepID=A0AAT9JHT2_9VIRU